MGGDAEFEALVATVVGFVESPGTGLALPLDIRGTVFQERVWQALRDRDAQCHPCSGQRMRGQ
jgi:AraC family transcriptional regulator of adaptative response/methylated-DNA-[protein]-cysteine methyltransferase